MEEKVKQRGVRLIDGQNQAIANEVRIVGLDLLLPFNRIGPMEKPSQARPLLRTPAGSAEPFAVDQPGWGPIQSRHRPGDPVDPRGTHARRGKKNGAVGSRFGG